MSVDANKAVVRGAIEEVWNTGDAAGVDRFYAPTFVFHQEGGENVNGAGNFKEWVRVIHAAFPDVKYTINAMYGEGDEVATRYSVTGTQTGDFRGLPATNKPINLTGHMIYRLQDGKTVEGWGYWDTLGLLEQLGVIGPPGSPQQR
jgi:steroid delta-isomerase-like uncharacterized protein